MPVGFRPDVQPSPGASHLPDGQVQIPASRAYPRLPPSYEGMVQWIVEEFVPFRPEAIVEPGRQAQDGSAQPQHTVFQPGANKPHAILWMVIGIHIGKRYAHRPGILQPEILEIRLRYAFAGMQYAPRNRGTESMEDSPRNFRASDSCVKQNLTSLRRYSRPLQDSRPISIRPSRYRILPPASHTLPQWISCRCTAPHKQPGESPPGWTF